MLWLLFLADQSGKLVAAHYEQPEEVLGKHLLFGLYRNDGIGFGLTFIPYAAIIAFVTLSIALLSFWLVHAIGKQETKIIWGVSLVLVGAVSNLIDRLAYGHVIDYLKLFGWPVFNLADVLIICGVLMIFVQWFKKDRIKNLLNYL